jgi:hypothetical protein
MEEQEFIHRIFVNSDILIKAIVDKDQRAKEKLERVILNLNPFKEKLEISQFVLSDVINKALEKGANLTSVYVGLVPGRGAYFDVVYIPDETVDIARAAMFDNIEYKLSLTDWTALIWMAENGMSSILSDKDNIEKVLEASRRKELKIPNHKDIPRIFDEFERIQRI